MKEALIVIHVPEYSDSMSRQKQAFLADYAQSRKEMLQTEQGVCEIAPNVFLIRPSSRLPSLADILVLARKAGYRHVVYSSDSELTKIVEG